MQQNKFAGCPDIYERAALLHGTFVRYDDGQSYSAQAGAVLTTANMIKSDPGWAIKSKNYFD